MKFEEYTPAELLLPFIKVYRIIESEDEMTNRVLPNTSLAVAFRYKGQVSYISGNNQEYLPASTISGLRKSVRLIHYLKNTPTAPEWTGAYCAPLQTKKVACVPAA